MDFHEFGKGVSAYVQLIAFLDDHKISDSAPTLIFAAMSRAGTAEIFKRYWHHFLWLILHEGPPKLGESP